MPRKKNKLMLFRSVSVVSGRIIWNPEKYGRQKCRIVSTFNHWLLKGLLLHIQPLCNSVLTTWYCSELSGYSRLFVSLLLFWVILVFSLLVLWMKKGLQEVGQRCAFPHKIRESLQGFMWDIFHAIVKHEWNWRRISSPFSFVRFLWMD